MGVTTDTDAGVQSGTELLYVAVDLGEWPSLHAYGDAVHALVVVARVATYLTLVEHEQLSLSRVPVDEVEPAIAIVRTSLASPWVSVLGELSQQYAPIAYGTAGLYTLQRLLRLLMEWQRHRAELEELRRRPMNESTERNRTWQVDQLAEVFDLPSGAAADLHSELQKANAALGRIQAAELIDTDDPRATVTAD